MEFKGKSSLSDSEDLNNLKNTELIYEALNAVQVHKMLDFEDSVLVSISGGPDSVFLLYFLNLIKKRYKLNLYAFHLDHMTRNGDSAKDAVFVKNLCLGLNIPLFSEEINVSNSCHERKLSFQEGARIIRRELLEKYLLENSIKKIAIAHNADDNIETFLMNLIRGTGLKGLGSISPVRGAIIRPLIDCSKLQIINFLNINNIAYCIDKTNSENRYFRNKIRNRIVPYIENEMGKGFKENILNTIILLRSGSGYIDGRVIEIIKKIQKNHGLDIFACARKGLLKIPAYDIENLDNNIKTFLVYKLIELVKGTPKDIISINVSDILKFCFPGGESKKINLPGGIVFIKEAEFIYIYNSAKISYKDLFSDLKQNESASISAEISQNEADNLLNSLKHVKSAKHRTNTAKAVDGTNASSNTNALSSPDILKEDVFNGEIVKSISGSNYRLKIKIINAASYDKKQIIYSGKNEAYMDLNKIKFPVSIREWQRGDKFMPFGMNNKKKLHDFFIDEGVPLHSRSSVPVFCDTEKIIWLGGLRIDERTKVDNDTRYIIYIVLEEIS